MPVSLSAQFSNCNEFFFAYQQCAQEHPVLRYFDYCFEFRKQMVACCKKERELSRYNNYIRSPAAKQTAFRKALAEQKKQQEKEGSKFQTDTDSNKEN